MYKFNNVKITAQAVVVPEREINIYDEAKYYDNSVKKIDRMRKMVGFWKRRVSGPDITSAEYAIASARKLFDGTGIDKNSIDVLIYMVQKPDFAQPANAFYIHKKLGLSDECAVMDIQQGCPAWVYGIWTAAQMLQGAQNKRILVLTGDIPSRCIDPSNRIAAPVFGDGGSATLLEYSQNAEPMYFNLQTYSNGFTAISRLFDGYRFGFNMKDKKDREKYLNLLDNPITTKSGHRVIVTDSYMDGLAVFNFTISKVPPNITALMQYANVKKEDIDYLCLHQANKQIVQAVGVGELEFPEDKVPYFAFENYGNNTMSSIPTTICSVVKDNRKDKMNLLCSGFGNGLAVASVYLTLDKDVKLFGISDYEKPSDWISRDEFIAQWTEKLLNS
jgi:3-oxoacyl-[acyl-carrier-protein] synthase-3